VRTLVVGAGFIGKAIARAAADAGHDVTVVSRRPFAFGDSDGHYDNGTVDKVVGNVCDPEVTGALVGPATHVFHCTGTAVPAAVEADPAADLATSLPPLLAVLGALARHEDTSITLLSSGGLVYGRPDHLPITEDHPTRPIAAAGVNKLVAEQYVKLHARRQRAAGAGAARVRILRCANAYGPEQPANRGQGIIATLLEAATTGTPVTVLGDGSTVRDYVHVDDVARAAVALVEHPEPALVLNVGSGIGTTVSALIATVERLAQRRLERITAPPRAIDVPAIVLDTHRLQSLLPGFVVRTVEDGITAMLQPAAIAART